MADKKQQKQQKGKKQKPTVDKEALKQLKIKTNVLKRHMGDLIAGKDVKDQFIKAKADFESVIDGLVDQ